MALDAEQPGGSRRSVRRAAEQRFRNREIARELAPLLLAKPLGHAAADELLDVGRVAPEHPRQAGEILAALGAQALKDEAGIVHH